MWVTEDSGYEAGTAFIDPPDILYVDLLNKSQGGTALKTSKSIKPDTTVSLLSYNHRGDIWQLFRGEAKWSKAVSEQSNCFLVGVAIKKDSETGKNIAIPPECRKFPNPSDIEFFNQTRLFSSIPREALCPMLNSLS